MHKYTDEQRQFILNNYKGIGTQELTDRFNRHFKTDLTRTGVQIEHLDAVELMKYMNRSEKDKNKIRLLATDSKIPNLAIMKISSYHKKKNDDVDWYDPMFDMYDTDILYESKVFTFSPEYQYYPVDAEIIRGGTGIDIGSKLPAEIEQITELDYSLYPDCDYSIQFLSRGCIRKCPFCVVPIKEGKIRKSKPFELNPKGKWIMILDNNFFACPQWRENIEIIRSWNQPVTFQQGLDLRIMTDEMAKALSTIKIKQVYVAWDNYEDKEFVMRGFDILLKYIKPYKITCYCLVGFKQSYITEEDLERVMTLKRLGVNPFAMGYINFDDPNYQKSKKIKDFCRWVNRKKLFKSCSWKEYNKRGITDEKINR